MRHNQSTRKMTKEKKEMKMNYLAEISMSEIGFNLHINVNVNANVNTDTW